MAIKYDEIENAFMFVSMDQRYMHNAILCKETGRIFYTSEMGDSDELPDDIDDPKYISIPHKNDLDLGKKLVIEFVSEFLPGELDKIDSIFRRRGAYSRYKELIYEKGLLEKWYQFENERQRAALLQWCSENNLEIAGLPSDRGAMAEIVQLGRDQFSEIRFLWESLNELHGKLSTHFKEHFRNFSFSDRMKLLEEKDFHTVFAALHENAYVGYCIASVKGDIGEIDSIYLKTDYRHSGIGKKLISEAEIWLKSRNALKIIVGVAEGNESVFGFYDKYGYRQRVTVLEKTFR